MIISLQELQGLIQQAVQLGIMSYKRENEPKQDVLSQRKAMQYVATLGYRPSILKTWEREGLIHGRRLGENDNSPIYYSRAEIKEVTMSIGIKRIVLDSMVDS